MKRMSGVLAVSLAIAAATVSAAETIGVTAAGFSAVTLPVADNMVLPANVTVARFANVFGSDMVLQRDSVIPVWGFAPQGAAVTVKLDEASQSATADATGRWIVTFPAISVPGGNHTLTLSVGDETLSTLTNIAIGDVWLCTGQSNMEMSTSWGNVVGATEALAAANTNDNLRFFIVPRTADKDGPHADVTPGLYVDDGESNPTDQEVGVWKTKSAEYANVFSAAGLFFALKIQPELGVPVGLVSSCKGGTDIEAWMSAGCYNSLSGITKRDFSGDRFNPMTFPLFPMAVKGAIWYQGCNNVWAGNQQDYDVLLPAMVDEWRRNFTSAGGSFPFYIVALSAPERSTSSGPIENGWAEMRWIQHQLGESVPSSGTVTTIDVGGDLHPADKKTVGDRLARMALVRTYGRTGFTDGGPRPLSAVGFGDTVVVSFANAANLSTTDGEYPSGFQIAGSDKVFKWADAAIVGDKVHVYAPAGMTAAHVRHAWDTLPVRNLVGDDGIPCDAFEFAVSAPAAGEVLPPSLRDVRVVCDATSRAWTGSLRLQRLGGDSAAGTQVYVAYGTADGGDVRTGWQNSFAIPNTTTEKEYAFTLPGLSAGTTYYLKAFAENGEGVNVTGSETLSFLTPSSADADPGKDIAEDAWAVCPVAGAAYAGLAATNSYALALNFAPSHNPDGTDVDGRLSYTSVNGVRFLNVRGDGESVHTNAAEVSWTGFTYWSSTPRTSPTIASSDPLARLLREAGDSGYMAPRIVIGGLVTNALYEVCLFNAALSDVKNEAVTFTVGESSDASDPFSFTYAQYNPFGNGTPRENVVKFRRRANAAGQLVWSTDRHDSAPYLYFALSVRSLEGEGEEGEEEGGDDPEVNPPAVDPDTVASTNAPAYYEGYELCWSDEFNVNGSPDASNWNYELGPGIRNNEAQTYTRENAVCRDGTLVIEGRKEQDGTYTSASLVSKGCRHFLYGRYEFRARIPTQPGAWPVMWMMGTNYTWPGGGEIDILEYYMGTVLCNWCWAKDDNGNQNWNASRTALSHFLEKDPDWLNKFHVWRMDWTEERCDVWVDGEWINGQTLDDTINGGDFGDGAEGISPFRKPQYILLDIAMGGNSGGTIDDAQLPMTMEVDYVRCYRRVNTNEGMFVPGAIDTTPGTGPAYEPVTNAPAKVSGFHLAWNDEFNEGDYPNTANWNVYDDGNVAVADGLLTITSREASGGTFPATSMDTKGLHSFTNGYIEVRARVPIVKGVFSSMWTETERERDENFYGYAEFMDVRYISGSPLIAGWVQWGPNDNDVNQGGQGVWFDRPLANLVESDPKWAAKFHVWKYAVDAEYVKVFVDGVEFFSRPLGWMNHNGLNTFGSDRFPHFLAMMLTTDAGATLDEAKLPAKLEVDYVRCYEYGDQEEEEGGDDSDDDDPTVPSDSLAVTEDGFTIRKYLLGWFDGSQNWAYVPYTEVTTLAAARDFDKNGLAAYSDTFGVVAGYVGNSTGDFDYDHNGGTDGGFPVGRNQWEGNTLFEVDAKLVMPSAGKVTLALGMPSGADFDLKLVGADKTLEMDPSRYDAETRRIVQTFDLDAGEYALAIGQFRAAGGDTYLEFSYVPGEVAAADFSTNRFALVGKAAKAPVEPEAPVVDGISFTADGKVVIGVSNGKTGLTYGYLFSETLECLATVEPVWLEEPVTAEGLLSIPAGDRGASGFFRIVVTD